jgi:hypothetical protein
MGISMKFISDEICADTLKPYTFTLDVRCSEGTTDSIPKLVASSVSANSCNPKAYLDSDAGMNTKCNNYY